MKVEIKNIIFDVGNVIVKWSPEDIISRTFPGITQKDQNYLINSAFKSDTWQALNLGIIEEDSAKQTLMKSLNVNLNTINELFEHINTTQSLIPGTVELIQRLKNNQYNLYGLTDNVHFIVAHLRQRYDFWQHLTHVTVSAEVGMMKPDEAIFNYVIKKNSLLPNETVFIDDHLPNTLSAKAIGMHALQFFDTNSCIEDLEKLGVRCNV